MSNISFENPTVRVCSPKELFALLSRRNVCNAAVVVYPKVQIPLPLGGRPPEVQGVSEALLNRLLKEPDTVLTAQGEVYAIKMLALRFYKALPENAFYIGYYYNGELIEDSDTGE